MKRNSYLLSVGCVAVLAMGGSACSRASEPAEAGVEASADLATDEARNAWHEAAAEATRNHLRTVAARGDARSLLAAAMLWPQARDDTDNGKAPAVAQERRAWFEAARSARPRDPLVAWFEASDCGGLSDSCDRDGALEFLLQAEPDNAAVHILALGAAGASATEQQIEALWQAAGQAKDYDSHALETSRLLYSAMSGASMPPLSPALAQAMSAHLGIGRKATPEELQHLGTMAVWSAVAIPSYQAITRGCRVDAREPLSPQRHSQCQRIMAMLAEDETILIPPTIGLRKMVELAGDGEDGAMWRERLRQFYWVYENALSSMTSSDGMPPPGYLVWVLQEGELPAMRKLLAANRISPVAPEGWLPERAEIRALLTPTAAKG